MRRLDGAEESRTRRGPRRSGAALSAAVANLYYAQPLLHTIGHDLGVDNGTAGLLVTITQIGYVLGLAFLVPVGDLLERRTLISATLLITAVAMAVA